MYRVYMHVIILWRVSSYTLCIILSARGSLVNI